MLQLLHIMEEWTAALENGRHINTIYTDFEKAFDKVPHRSLLKQELSYCQQIVRQLRTQYVEGMYRLKYYTVTLKSRLRVIQGHWKQNHWIDHTRLSSSRVI